MAAPINSAVKKSADVLLYAEDAAADSRMIPQKIVTCCKFVNYYLDLMKYLICEEKYIA